MLKNNVRRNNISSDKSCNNQMQIHAIQQHMHPKKARVPDLTYLTVLNTPTNSTINLSWINQDAAAWQ
jgi:hypothetical protein